MIYSTAPGGFARRARGPYRLDAVSLEAVVAASRSDSGPAAPRLSKNSLGGVATSTSARISVGTGAPIASVVLIPPPRFHMLRYHGVLAAHAKHRREVVPG